MKNLSAYLFGLLLLVSATSSKAQNVWDLQKCIDYAIENNIQIKQQGLNTQYGENQVKQAKDDKLPNLNAQLGNDFSFGRSLTYDNTYDNINSASLSGGLNTSMTLFNGMTLTNIVKQRQLDLEATLNELQKTKDDIMLAISAEYLQILFAEEVILVSEANIEVTKQQINRTKQLVDAGADVVALDVSERRMQRLRENLTRTGLHAEIVVQDALEHRDQYDAILLDAPCSATGTIRRHPDLPFAKNGDDFGDLIELQARMLAHAWSLLRPGGRMVYCTCSLLPDEGEAQIDAALEAFSDMRVDPEALDLPGIDPDWISSEGGLRVRPDYWSDRGGMDGFYIACLRKSG